MAVTYEWKVDFAIVLSFAGIGLTIVLHFIQQRSRRKQARLDAYEAVYEDACWILGLPYERKKRLAKELIYENDDKELERHVREYLDSHWMSRTWGNNRFVPSRYFLPLDRLNYLKRVMDEASRFQDEHWRVRSNISELEKSPVNWMEEEDVRVRMKKVHEEVGRRLSRFSHKIREHWHSATFANPQEVRREYERALRVCPNFFRHNERDFKDPYFDLLSCIRRSTDVCRHLE